MKRLHVYLTGLLAAACSLGLSLGDLRAQDPAAPDAAPTPSLTPKPRPKPKPTPDASVPAGTVNGVAVYRPLMKSVVADPVDRTLLIYDYNKREGRPSDAQVEDAVHDLKRTRFSNNEAAFNAKLSELGATPADFRQFVTEEIKLRLELASITRGSVSDTSAQRAEKAYIARLRQQARVNQPRG